jgi:uncharacterized protein (TIGR02145 family)
MDRLISVAFKIVVISALGLGYSGCSSDSGNSGDSGGGVPPPTPEEKTNNAPSIDTTFSDITLEENNGTTNYQINVSDIEGDALSLTVESNNTSIVTVTPNWTNTINQATYSTALDFNLTTVADAFGMVKITINLSDDSGETNTTTSFDVNVTEVFQSGETWKGLVYETVTSPHTGKVWLDRNLGATQVCTAPNDNACYGDYYQWGRDADDHEKFLNITTTATLADSITPAHTQFITSDSGSYDWVADGVDNDGSLRSAKWSKTDGSSVCPVGYRVPTEAELAAETTGASTPIANNTDAFNSFLKLPSAGSRISNGLFFNIGLRGDVWSSSPDGSNSKYLFFQDSADWFGNFRTYGRSVRCLKDE